MYNQWRNVNDLSCNSTVDTSSIAGNITVSTNKKVAMCFENGIDVMDFYAVNKNPVFEYMGILIAYNIIFRLLGFIALQLRSLSR